MTPDRTGKNTGDDEILAHLNALYSEKVTWDVFGRLKTCLQKYRIVQKTKASTLTQRDAILITYGDQVSKADETPLYTLASFCKQYLKGLISGIHILPFFPYSSDDGFSVIDFRSVDPALGSWDDIIRIGKHFRLMFDAVINHISTQSVWFQEFLRDEAPYMDYFIVIQGDPDLTHVVRPRALPLLSTFSTPSGEKAVWTTFSIDQVDLNYQNPDVLIEMIDLILYYVSKGAEIIRLDAIAYLWKETGTPCIHLPQTHHVIQLFRQVLDEVAPHVLLITETNVPHAENISYFGDGTNEAQLVYNFALPPLVLHTFRTGNAQPLTRWAASLELPSNRTTFFNFLASHDGIGVTPARGLISEADIEALVGLATEHEGYVSYRNNADGTQSPYELNINYFDALSSPTAEEPVQTQIDRFTAAHAIMFALVGTPGIYFHSLFGSRSWNEGVTQTGRYRTINRQRLSCNELESALTDPGSFRAQVYGRLAILLRARRSQPAFDPYGSQEPIHSHEGVFALLRFSPDGKHKAICLHNVNNEPISPAIRASQLPFASSSVLTDLLTGQRCPVMELQTTRLKPYQVAWLVPD
jgi:sucrose phosphorylase